MQRRVMTEKDKKAYEKKVRGYITPKEFFKKKSVRCILIALVVIVISLLGVSVFLKTKPLTVADLIGNDYCSVEFTDNSYAVSLDELKSYTVDKAFPGSFGDASKYDCYFYDEQENKIGTVTFIAGQPYFLFNNQVYSYKRTE